ncbi:MAG TPA: helix-turn-helix transcriptional regulator [Frankiaceae bacterium]|nr:helix-turn-helix transcriptional regulator [Frankiaceae bacterium]
MPQLNVRGLGEYIREQRRTAQISLRQLARQAGVSNPYLSQIERGLRKPSAEILQQIAKALRISAEAMYVQAGILEEREGGEFSDSVLRDPFLTERQRQVLLEIYTSFRNENEARAAAEAVEGLAAEEGLSVEVTLQDQPNIRVAEAPASSPRRRRPSADGPTGQATA